ncbi:MAG: helix-turn-helix transcriptional regulator [Caulobacter sp.]|nr:helix-turn-helix transcriptional regulator [Caulobacter sp.]
MAADHEPHLVDIHVGSRVRMRRRSLGLSQTELASSVGLTFQQLQKYERGANRISASKLYGMAKTLQVPLSWFFEGLSSDAASAGEDQEADERKARMVQVFLASSEGLDLATLFPRIPPHQRRQILALARSLGQMDGGQDEEEAG